MNCRWLTIANTSDINGGQSLGIIPREDLAIITVPYDRKYGIRISRQQTPQIKQAGTEIYVHSS